MAAVVLKRSWFSAHPDRPAALARELVAGAERLIAEPAARDEGLLALGAVVDEFSAARSSAMGAPLDFHRRCAASFEALCAQLGAERLATLQEVAVEVEQQASQPSLV